MKKAGKIILLFSIILIIFNVIQSCNKWTDPKPTTDPRLTNPYCNDPNAVNYNWGFPGKPDNTICYYPVDLFKGRYSFIDSVYLQSNGYFIFAKTDTLTIYSLPPSLTKLAVLGFCSAYDSLKLTANASFIASIDSLVGDSITTRGQLMMCRLQDTINGTITFGRSDSLLHISFQVISDTGITNHVGIGRKF